MNEDIVIKDLEDLKKTLEEALENWQNSELCDTEMGQEMIETCKRIIKETEEEIEAHIQAKKTGVFISKEARAMLRKIKDNEDFER